MNCRGCRVDLIRHEGQWYPGFGRLCEDCNSRATVITNDAGHAVRVSIEPKSPEVNDGAE